MMPRSFSVDAMPPGMTPKISLTDMERFFTAVATRIAGFVGQPEAFVVALASIVVWAATGPLFGYSDTWQLVVNTATTVVTSLLCVLIQGSQDRDARTIQVQP